MIVVSDISPLNYLVLLEVPDVLPKLFGRVVVPTTVARELSHSKAPKAVQAWIANPPSWLEILVQKKSSNRSSRDTAAVRASIVQAIP